MTIAQRLLLAPLLLAAACNTGAKLAAAKFAGPSALAVFQGYSAKHPGELRPYLAVANTLRDELTVVDPLDKELVLSATLSFPLAVPTRPRPLKLAAASLGDGGADLLVVATQSPPSLQLVATWAEELKAVDLPAAEELSSLYPGAALLSLAAASKPGGGAWVLVGLSGGHLAVLEFERDASSTLPLARQPVRRSALALQQKELLTSAGRFDALDLALAPDASRVFVATADPLQDGGGATVHGVGQLTVIANSAASTWPVVGLDARAPTRLVAAASLVERTVASAVVFNGTPVLQAFAVLDEQGCGRRAGIDCGLVTLVPDVGLAPDPAGELPYRAPITFTAPPTALAVVRPRANAAAAIGAAPVGLSFPAGDPPAPFGDFLYVGTAATFKYAIPTLLAVATAGGAVVAVDLSRWSPVNAVQAVEADHRALVQSVITGASAGATRVLGLWNDVSVARKSPAPAPAVDIGASTAPAEVRFTQGYLADEKYQVSWRGPLPGLASRNGILQVVGGQPVVAIQKGSVASVHLADPELAIHLGDTVRVVPLSGVCGNGAGFLATITAIRPPDADFPGGSLALSHAGLGGAGQDQACPTPLAVVSDAVDQRGPVASTLTVNAQELVLVGAEALGYLGRPVMDQDFALRYQPEAGLSGEELMVARKLRRRFYPADPPCGASIPGTKQTNGTDPVVEACDSLADATKVPPIYPPDSPDPLTPGPAIRFRIGRGPCPGSPNTPGCAPCADGAPIDACAPGAGATLTIATRSGLQSAAWVSPATRGAATALASIDESGLESGRATAIYAAFVTNEVLAIVPETGNTVSIR